jgi:hypothetical protein
MRAYLLILLLKKKQLIIKVGSVLFNPLNAELNPIRHLLALAGAHHFVDVSRIRVKDAVAC